MSVAEVNVDELASLMAEGARVIDVRNPDEFAAGRVPGVTLVPLDEVPDRLDEFASDGVVYVICRSGARSMRACVLAVDAGHSAVNVAGGTLAWIDSGRDVETGPA